MNVSHNPLFVNLLPQSNAHAPPIYINHQIDRMYEFGVVIFIYSNRLEQHELARRETLAV
jgi:hypothetical protein